MPSTRPPRLTGFLREFEKITGNAPGAVSSEFVPARSGEPGRVAATRESAATRFGGPGDTAAAHRLFAADSRRLLAYLAGNGPGLRRELPVILATRLLRAARQDWYEQGDAWEQMAAHRGGSGRAPEPGAAAVSAMLALLTAGGDAPGSPLGAQPDWPSAFEDAGRQIAALAGRGVLARGSARSSPSTFCSSSTGTGSQPPTSTRSPPPPSGRSSAPPSNAPQARPRTQAAGPEASLQSVP